MSELTNIGLPSRQQPTKVSAEHSLASNAIRTTV